MDDHIQNINIVYSISIEKPMIPSQLIDQTKPSTSVSDFMLIASQIVSNTSKTNLLNLSDQLPSQQSIVNNLDVTQSINQIKDYVRKQQLKQYASNKKPSSNKTNNQYQQNHLSILCKIITQQQSCDHQRYEFSFKQFMQNWELNENQLKVKNHELWRSIREVFDINQQNAIQFFQMMVDLVPKHPVLKETVAMGLDWGVFRKQIWVYCTNLFVKVKPNELSESSLQNVIELKDIILSILKQTAYSEATIPNKIVDLLDILVLMQKRGIFPEKQIQQLNLFPSQQIIEQQSQFQQLYTKMQQHTVTPQEITQYIQQHSKYIYNNLILNSYSSSTAQYQSFVALTNILMLYSMISCSQLNKVEELRRKCTAQIQSKLLPNIVKFMQGSHLQFFIKYKEIKKRLQILYTPLISQHSEKFNGQVSFESIWTIFKFKAEKILITVNNVGAFVEVLKSQQNPFLVNEIISYLLIFSNIISEDLANTYQFTLLYQQIIQVYCHQHPSWFTLQMRVNSQRGGFPHLYLEKSQQYDSESIPKHLWNFIELSIKLKCTGGKLNQKLNGMIQNILSVFQQCYEQQFISVYFATIVAKYQHLSSVSNNYQSNNQYFTEFLLERASCIHSGSVLLQSLNSLQSLSSFEQLCSFNFYIHLNQPLIKSHSDSNTLLTFQQVNVHNPQLEPIVWSNFYRNHWTDFVYGRFLAASQNYLLGKLYEKQYFAYLEGIQTEIKSAIQWLLNNQNDLKANSEKFYQSFRAYKYIYIFIDVLLKSWLSNLTSYSQNVTFLLDKFIELMKVGNIHPLMRQYLSIIFAKAYLASSQTTNKYRTILMKWITNTKIDLNSFVPVLLLLGYQMCKLCIQNETISRQIFNKLLQFISCHHAYVRSIAQYYISKYIQTVKEHKDSDFGFLEHLCYKVWKYDKDCIKIMKNIGVVVEGFKEVVESNVLFDYLGFERVEEYPHQRVSEQFQSDMLTIRNCINCQFNSNLLINEELIKSKHGLQLRFRDPDIVIIASLLQKVHNFGHILRTIHNLAQKNFLLVVPSKQPLIHAECLELIPKNSQVHVIEIKPENLSQFIFLYKRKYPLIGLEQCSNSITIQKFKFPTKYMLLLGNERIGAPSSLLNLADHLLEIPQVGKVRSLNVHVSMVICLWHSITYHQSQNIF